MKTNELKELLREFDNDVRFEHDLKKKNWFNIGGKTKAFYKANNLKDLVKFLKNSPILSSLLLYKKLLIFHQY